jgi:hypothetical protein
MSLITDIQNEKNGSPLTYKQGQMLFRLTSLKFWQPETLPQPTVKQASLLIDACMTFVKEKTGGKELLQAIQIWFPSFDDLSDVHFRFSRKGEEKEQQEQPQTDQNPNQPEKPKGGRLKRTPDAPKPKEEKQSTKKQQTKPTPEESKNAVGCDEIESLINAGIKNIWMVGPAGCGKTTITQQVGEILELPVTIIPCGAGTSATTFLGYKYPEREGTPFVHAFAQPGIVVLDEFTALEAQVAQIVNGALANNELTATTGTFQRHEECYIIATSNTFGNGADRIYVSNNQLDASTRDRFAGGVIEVDYSDEYENQYDHEVVDYVRRLRRIVKTNGFRKVVSTRSIISGCKLKESGLNWKQALTADWTTDEKACI